MKDGGLRFEVFTRDGQSAARRGRVTTPHGTFETPAFMPVGTRGTIKGILPHLVKEAGAEIVLNNTYHLMIRPGPEVVERIGGVHGLTNWPGPMLTDSGGYQAFSLAVMNKVTDNGVRFKSHVDGAEIELTPERAMRVQNQLGADIIMAFDDCPPSELGLGADGSGVGGTDVDPRLGAALKRDNVGDRGEHERRLDVANERTVRWLERCVRAHGRGADQALFGIVQGGTDLGRRTWSAERIVGIELPGYAIGGVAVGESSEEIAKVVRHTAPLLPWEKPRYLMGVGYERDILAAVLSGVDMFDCTLPTRNGRNANAFTSTGQVRLRNAKYAEDRGPIEAGCDCPACDPHRHGWAVPGPFSRASIRHLFQAGEMLGPILASLHNLRHFQRFMSDLRGSIGTGNWASLATRWPVAVAGFPSGFFSGSGAGDGPGVRGTS